MSASTKEAELENVYTESCLQDGKWNLQATIVCPSFGYKMKANRGGDTHQLRRRKPSILYTIREGDIYCEILREGGNKYRCFPTVVSELPVQKSQNPVRLKMEGDMFKLTADNYSYCKPMMEDHLYCKDLYEPITNPEIP
ncbi:hypothetical protein V8G54_026955 [Vigna mungo]|uniref:Uncharacterized protein n=1 Tax=Vigna mungo TaxID=3915 RepID=A0AAQ3RQX6_VIGMU